MKVMILLEDNLAIYRKADEQQAKKAEIVHFDDETLKLLKQGFKEEEQVSLAGSSIVSYETLL